MSKIYFYKDNIYFDFNKESEQIIYNYIRSNWGVNPKLQVIVDENNEVFLTNKFGEKFTCIGHII
jgi:hypothetical protein